MLYQYFVFQQPAPTAKPENSTGASTPEDDDDEEAPPPIATRPDKTKSIVSLKYFFKKKMCYECTLDNSSQETN